MSNPQGHGRGRQISLPGAHHHGPIANLFGAPPCFYFASCRGTSAACKNGKSLCQACLDKTPGAEYPLRKVLDTVEARRLETFLAQYSSHPN